MQDRYAITWMILKVEEWIASQWGKIVSIIGPFVDRTDERQRCWVYGAAGIVDVVDQVIRTAIAVVHGYAAGGNCFIADASIGVREREAATAQVVEHVAVADILKQRARDEGGGTVRG